MGVVSDARPAPAVVLRGSTRWVLMIFGPFFCWLSWANYRQGDLVAAVLCLVFGVGAIVQGLRTRVIVSHETVRYIGFFWTRTFRRADIVDVRAVFKGRSFAPRLMLRTGKKVYLSGLSGGYDRVQSQVQQLTS